MRWTTRPGLPGGGNEADPGELVPVEHPALDEVLAALTEEAGPRELDGLGRALSAYRAAVPAARNVQATTTRRAFVITGLLSAKAAAAFGGAALGLGAAAMVVTLSLPRSGPDAGPVLPAAQTTSSASTQSDDDEGVGPDATGPAAHGLCTAWSRHQANGSTDALASVPMQNLVRAAGGADKVEAYCATVGHPGKGHSQDAKNKSKNKDEKQNKNKNTDDNGDTGESEDPGEDTPTTAPKSSTPAPSTTAPNSSTPAPSTTAPNSSTPAPSTTATATPSATGTAT